MTIKANETDKLDFALAATRYMFYFDGVPSWVPDDEFDIDVMMLTLAEDRDRLIQRTSEMMEVCALAYPAWVKNNRQPLVDEVEA